MNTAWTLATNAFALHWGNLMLRALAQGTLVIGLVWLLCQFVPRLSASTRGWLWWLACLKLLCGLLWVTPVSLALLPTPKPTVRPDRAPFFDLLAGALPRERGGLRTARSSVVSRSVVTETAPLTAAPAPSPPRVGLSLAAICLALWLAGVAFRFGGTSRQLLVLRRMVKRTRACRDASVISLAGDVAQSVGLRDAPNVRVSDETVDPLVVGPLHPRVVLAQATLERLSAGELRTLLAHEFAHVRRGDLWLGLIPMLAENLFFFLPPVWLACREFALAREAACDVEAVQATNTPARDYGHLLIKLGDLRADLCPTGALAATSNFRMLQRRIVMLQDLSRVSGRRVAGGALMLALVGVAGLVPWRIVAAQETKQETKIPRSDVQLNAAPVSGASPSDAVPTVNIGSHTDWAKYPTEPVNLDFAQGVAHWQNVSESGTGSKYKISTSDKNPPPNGFHWGAVESLTDFKSGDGSLIQKVRADKWRGKRVRFSAYLKTHDATQGACLVLHIDQPNTIRVWGGDKPIVGTSAWVERAVVVDVPADAQGFIFGVSLFGKGHVAAGMFHFAEVSKDVPADKPSYDSEANEEAAFSGDTLPAAPLNPDFKQGLEGWANDNPDHTANKGYRIGTDNKEKQNGVASAYLSSKVAKPHSYGTLMQNISPAAYKGKRIRLSADMKTLDVENYAGMWLVLVRPNDAGASWHSAMQIKGATDWKRYEYVIDVPEDATYLSFGLALEGQGKIWANAFRLDVVGNDVPLTPPTDDGAHSQWKGDTSRVTSLWPIGRAGKYAALRAAAEAIVNDANALPEERATARESLVYALTQLKEKEEALRQLDLFEQEAKTLTLDTGVIAEAKRLRAALK